jgi:lipopolysaccharide transport system permease protein
MSRPAAANPNSLAELSRVPLIEINSSPSPIVPQLKDAWDHRELLYFLIWRDLKVRYRQTFLGVAWVVLQPLLFTLVFTIFFNKLGQFPSEGIPYPLFAYAGLLPWTFFANTVAVGCFSLIGNSSIITKTYFPRLLIPVAIVGVRLVDMLVASSVLVVLMLFYGVGIHRNLLMLPLFVLLTTVFAAAIASWLSVLTIRYRDIGTLLPVVIQVWMFTSPVIYPAAIVPGRWRTLFALNPFDGIINGFRGSFFGLPFDWMAIAIAVLITLAATGYILFVFTRWHERLIDQL